VNSSGVSSTLKNSNGMEPNDPRFSLPFCREFVLRVHGSFHGCVDFLLVARVIFVSFSSYFRWIFVRALFI
jgi:hypothetical protein